MTYSNTDFDYSVLYKHALVPSQLSNTPENIRNIIRGSCAYFSIYGLPLFSQIPLDYLRYNAVEFNEEQYSIKINEMGNDYLGKRPFDTSQFDIEQYIGKSIIIGVLLTKIFKHMRSTVPNLDIFSKYLYHIALMQAYPFIDMSDYFITSNCLDHKDISIFEEILIQSEADTNILNLLYLDMIDEYFHFINNSDLFMTCGRVEHYLTSIFNDTIVA